MRASHLIFLFLALAASAHANPPEKSNPLIGTWRWISVNGHSVERQPFYMKFNADGTSASWPSPKGWGDKNGVSHGKYSIKNKRIILELGDGKQNPAAPFEIKGDELIMRGDEDARLLYRRVTPAPAEGKLENGRPAGFFKDPP